MDGQTGPPHSSIFFEIKIPISYFDRKFHPGTRPEPESILPCSKQTTHMKRKPGIKTLSFPILSLIFLLISGTLEAQGLHPLGQVLRIHSGLISGSLDPSGSVRIYEGIPYAAPPVGALRWKAPRKVLPWKGIRPCTSFPASEIQMDPVPFMMYTPEFLIPSQPRSEDCLYLNIWAPARNSRKKRPVLVWIHGGGFVSGSGSCPIYDGTQLARKGVVFVSINYRLGVFGFLALGELDRESAHHASGNYGLLDQIAALHWVQKNIAAFGGDPGNITIAGQSAGSFSVNILMASPLAMGLFQKAIAESGGVMDAHSNTLSRQQAEANGRRLMQQLGVKSLEALRRIPASRLLAAQAKFPALPVVDGYVLPRSAYDLFRAGAQNQVPLLLGWNHDDGFLPFRIPGPEQYRREIHTRFAALAPQFLKQFPGSNPAQVRESLLALSRDTLFAWQAYTWARMETQRWKDRVYLYRFDRCALGEQQYGAFHTSEVPFVLHNLQAWKRPWTRADYQLEDTLSSYWVNFARKGNPNGPGLPAWKPFEVQRNLVMTLNTTGIGPKPITVLPEFRLLDRYLNP